MRAQPNKTSSFALRITRNGSEGEAPPFGRLGSYSQRSQLNDNSSFVAYGESFPIKRA